ncbi:tRNA (adenine(22)-N(1))-methyltransferase [Jeotgalibacillus proteolyticus]|uniref:tRNA (Adenine(22)-N(1))-methyltransferase TrmK n=1 Tax=Jeotgalibacillus proteolyticus TaxID=2082395 RepID=A0A2S5GEL2_9BACL|nr:tRNA (adenine(22)-N(1))-methyltransferase TrmK [Jeotgalibacillus proteolyticus]PPA71436.1 tRNA (adenine(22)-N(1))-methyltransferase TrmK [Jeotgalibacillus proteolyticus]
MNSEKLSLRLSQVAAFVPRGSKVADIGSDHAYLPCYLVLQQKAVSAIAGEVVEGPYQSALKQVKNNNLEHLIEVRKGSGLSVLKDGEADVITIAGMGGPLIVQILDEGKEKLKGVKRLILQPNISAISIRDWLIKHNWKVVEETILEEDQKIYEIIVAEPSEITTELTYTERLLGPVLIKKKSAVFKRKWMQEYEQWKNISNQLDLAGKSQTIAEKRAELEAKMAIVEEALK